MPVFSLFQVSQRYKKQLFPYNPKIPLEVPVGGFNLSSD